MRKTGEIQGCNLNLQTKEREAVWPIPRQHGHGALSCCLKPSCGYFKAPRKATFTHFPSPKPHSSRGESLTNSRLDLAAAAAASTKSVETSVTRTTTVLEAPGLAPWTSEVRYRTAKPRACPENREWIESAYEQGRVFLGGRRCVLAVTKSQRHTGAIWMGIQTLTLWERESL